MIRRILLVSMLLGAPAPVASQASTAAPASRVDVNVERLMQDLGVLAHDSMEGRAVGTPGNLKARTYLLRRFRETGVEPLGSSLERPFRFTGRGAAPERQGVNLIGVIRGQSAPDRYIVVTAHYDHVGVRNGEVFNGADDNASGTAALLAIAEHLRRQPPEHSVIIAALDAEESGLRGARALIDDPPVPREAILANVNMDMLGRNDAGELWAAGTYHYPQLLPLVERVAEGAPLKLRIGHDRPGVAGQEDWTSASDHGPFHAAGIPFLYFGVEDHADYHKATDEVAGIQPDFFARAVATVITALTELDRFF